MGRHWQRPSQRLSPRGRPRRRAALAAALLGLGLAGCADDSAGGIASQKLAAVKARGQLVCGVDGRLPGFSFVQPDGSYRGLDVDICRAVAAAVLADPEQVQFRDLNASERFAALASGEVDLLSRNTTYTLGRDASGGNGLSFAPVVFYDGQGVMTRQGSGVRRLQDLAGKPICVESGTTTELNLADRMRELGAAYTPLKFQASDQTYAAYLQGRCAAITSDRSQLAARRTGFPDPANHTLLPEVLSKEPLAPATVNGDPGWADAVRWIVYGLMQAEEQGITQANVQAKLAEARANADRPDLRRFLGVDGDLGVQLGLPADFVVRAVQAVGNYGELLERHVGMGSTLKLERGLNRQWRDGGLIYAPPFR